MFAAAAVPRTDMPDDANAADSATRTATDSHWLAAAAAGMAVLAVRRRSAG